MESTRFKRRTPRVATGWAGKYVVEDDPASDWSDCRVTDLSIMGVGLELCGDTAQDLIGRQVIVQVQSQVEESLTFTWRVRFGIRVRDPEARRERGWNLSASPKPNERSCA